MVDPALVGVVDEELAEEAVEDEDETDVQGEVGHVAEAVLRPDPVPAPPDGRKKNRSAARNDPISRPKFKIKCFVKYISDTLIVCKFITSNSYGLF